MLSRGRRRAPRVGPLLRCTGGERIAPALRRRGALSIRFERVARGLPAVGVLLFLQILAVPLAAQASIPISIWPDAASFATRGYVGDQHRGVIAVGFGAASFRGLGGASVSTRGRLTGFRATVQNQDASRAMSFSMAAVADDAGQPGSPDLREVLVDTPVVRTPVEGNLAIAYRMTVTFGTAADVLPAAAGWHLVLDLPAGDGGSFLYVHAADDRLGLRGDNARRDAPATSLSVDLVTGLERDLGGRAFDLAALTPMPLFALGATIDPALRRGPDPDFGRAGLFPSRGRGDGVAFRIDTGGVDDGVVVVLGSPLGFTPWPVAFPGVDGALFLLAPLMPSSLWTAPITPGGRTQGVSPLAPFPFRTPLGALEFQAILLTTAGVPVLTNAVALRDGS